MLKIKEVHLTHHLFREFFVFFVLLLFISITSYNLNDFKTIKEDFLYLPKAEHIEIIALDYNGLLADMYWIKGVTYFGSHYYERGFYYKWLYKLFDLATALDPHYYDIYWYGSLLLDNTKEANKLLAKGMIYFPQDWKLPEMIGFNYHRYEKDMKKAAQYYALASTLPAHPPYIPSLSARFYNEAGCIEEAIKVLKNFRDVTTDKWLQEDFDKRIIQLEHIKILEQAIALYKDRYNKYPVKLEDLVAVQILRELPIEPYKGFYFWDLIKKRVWSSSDPVGMERLKSQQF